MSLGSRKDAGELGRFYETVVDAVGPTRQQGPGETMTTIDIGPTTQLNVFVRGVLQERLDRIQ
jgi:hypothetical protein